MYSGEAGRIDVGTTNDEADLLACVWHIGTTLQRGQGQGGGGLHGQFHFFPEPELCGADALVGQQQRVALARAFVTEPKLLFADEPTGNLDFETGDHIIELLFALNRERGTTLILVTHDAQLAARCDRRLRLVDGQLREEA